MPIIEPGGGRVFKRMNDMTVKVKSSDTNGTYEMCEEKCPPGFESRRHMHAKDFETFYMVSGNARWEVGDEVVDAVKGHTIHIPPNTPHKVKTEEGCEMICIFGPGQQEGQFEEMSNLTEEQQQDDALKKSILAKYNMIPLE